MHQSIVALEDEGTMFKAVTLKDCINNEVLIPSLCPHFSIELLFLSLCLTVGKMFMLGAHTTL